MNMDCDSKQFTFLQAAMIACHLTEKIVPEATPIAGVAHAAPDTTRAHVHAYANAAELLESSRSGSNDEEASSVTPAAARLA